MILYQAWSFLAPAIEEHTQRVVSLFVLAGTLLFVAGVAFGYFVVLDQALEFLTTYDDDLYDIQIRASYYYSFVSLALLAMGLMFELPVFVLALVRLGVLTAAQLRRNRRIGYFLMLVIAVLLPTVDPVSLALETLPLVVLFELSIQLSAIMERRWAKAGVLWARRGVTVYSADWVLPVEGEPIRDGAVAVEGARIAAVGTAAELGAGERFEGAAIVPGFVNAHTHLEYAVYAGFGDGLPFGPWIKLHIERKANIGFDEMVDIARLGAAESLRSGITTVGDYSYAGAAAVACAELGLRAIVYLEVFGLDAREALTAWEQTRERAGDAFDGRVALGVSPHAPYSCSEAVFEACAELGVPLGTHLSESPGEIEWLLRGTGELSPLSWLYVEPRGETGVATLERIGLLGPDLLAAHCVQVDPDEIALIGERGVRVAHCPRSNALLGCGIAPVAELRAAGAIVGIGTDSPASAPSFDMFDEIRAAVAFARAREQRTDVLSGAEALELATLGGARALGLDADVGSLVPGKRADLAVVSLEGSPYAPVEDPATAVVLGGAPTRVLLTLIDGEVRYRKDEFDWRALTAGATRARSLLLQAPSATRAPT